MCRSPRWLGAWGERQDIIVLKEGQRASNVGVFRESQGQGGKKEHYTAQILVRLLPLVSSEHIGSSAYGKDASALEGR